MTNVLRTAEIFRVQSGGITPVLLRLTTDDDVAGLGEAAVAYGIGSSAAAAMLMELCEHFLMGGVNPFRIESVTAAIKDHTFWAKGGGPR